MTTTTKNARGIEIPTKIIKIAGAQIPCGTNIQANKTEILKAIDWAKENNVDHLLTPEGSLSGYLAGWEQKIDEIKDALKEIEEHISDCGFCLHLGTNFEEPEFIGKAVNRNEIRHYYEDGTIGPITYKTFVLNERETVLGRQDYNPISLIDLIEPSQETPYVPQATGMICNDMWGATEARKEPLSHQIRNMNLDLIFHATNGRKMELDDPQMIIFDSWHDAHLRMTAGNLVVPILTVDSCSDWEWDGSEETAEYYHTSSQSGVIDINGWQTDVPRVGRQYFSYDLDVTLKPDEKFYIQMKTREQEQASSDSV